MLFHITITTSYCEDCHNLKQQTKNVLRNTYVFPKLFQSGCAALRRQKELELQVVTGEVRGWPGGELATLGDVLHMGSVAVGPSHQDRYLVLFPSALLLLSVSKRVSAFVYEVKLRHLSEQ